MKQQSIFTLLIMLLIISAHVLAGVEYKVETTQYKSGSEKTEEVTVEVEGKNLKMQPEQDPENTMIYQGEKRQMVVVNHKDKTFSIINKAVIEEMGAKMQATVDESMTQVNEALKNLPPDKRAMVEKMMKDKKIPGMPQQTSPAAAEAARRAMSEYENTGEKSEKNGYPCVKYIVTKEGKKTHEHWVTDWKNVEGGEETAAAFSDMATFFQEMMDAFASSSGMGAMPFNFDANMFAGLNSLGGLPIATKDYADDGSLESESSLRSAERRDLDPDAFEPPSGYKRQEMFQQ